MLSTEPADKASRGALACRHVSKRFAALTAVDDVSVSFQAGRVTALMGSNGAGKTTLFNLLAGAIAPDSGEIWLSDQRIDGARPWQTAGAGIGRLFQDVRVFGQMTVLDNVLVGFRGQLGENPSGSLLRVRAVARQEAANREQALHWLERFGLEAFAGTPAGSLSYGQQKLVALVRLLVGQPRVLLLDEPAAGMNRTALERLSSVIRDAAARGCVVVVVEHDISFVMEQAEWIEFMDQGRILACGEPASILGDDRVRRAYLGL